MKTIRELQDQIALFRVEPDYEPSDMLEVLNILSDTLAHLARIEATANRAANEASCLANGIQPD